MSSQMWCDGVFQNSTTVLVSTRFILTAQMCSSQTSDLQGNEPSQLIIFLQFVQISQIYISAPSSVAQNPLRIPFQSEPSVEHSVEHCQCVKCGLLLLELVEAPLQVWHACISLLGIQSQIQSQNCSSVKQVFVMQRLLSIQLPEFHKFRHCCHKVIPLEKPSLPAAKCHICSRAQTDVLRKALQSAVRNGHPPWVSRKKVLATSSDDI